MKTIPLAITLVALMLMSVSALAADDADNSKRNVADRNEASVTPGDQGSSDADIAITREIRKSVVDQDGLSMNAKNVKIVTSDGVVTLRGPVADPAEKERIASIAAKVDGVKQVDDQLEVDASR
jgi:hyperosmotically inducible protein